MADGARWVEPRVGIAASVIGLLFVHTHPIWRPWTGGLVTDAFARTVLAADLALGVQLLGWVAVVRSGADPRWRRLLDPVFAAAGLGSLWVFHDVYPLDFAAVGLGSVNGVVRFALGVAVLAVGLAVVVSLVRAGGAVLELLGADQPGPGADADAKPAEADKPHEPHRPPPQRPPPPRSRRHR